MKTPFSGFGRFYLVLASLMVGGTLYLWFAGQELFTEAREKAEASAPDNTPGVHNHPRRRYGFGYIGYHGGK